MPQRAKGARLYLRKSEGGRAAEWTIRDGKLEKRLGLGPLEGEAAETRLAEYLAEKHQPSRARGRDPAQIPIADVLSIYLDDVVPKVARPKEAGARAARLLEWWGERTLSQITGKLCRSYAAERGSQAAARRELEDLRAAIIHHRKEGLCDAIVDVVLPDKSRPRERWLTRSEAARLLWAAWRGKEGNRKFVKEKRRHIARFILVALYTGTRAGAICGAAIRPTIGRGFVDLDRGVFYRKALDAKETKKRQPPVRLPAELLAHMRRWERKGICRKSVVEYRGEPIERIAKGFRNAARDAGLDDVCPHILRHTAVTWAMQGGADLWEAAGLFGMTVEVLESTYGHHRPDAGESVYRAMKGRKSGPASAQHQQNETRQRG